MRYYVGGLLGIYLAACAAIWTLLQASGVRTVGLSHLLWPPAWGQLSGDIADHYRRQAMVAFQRHEFQTAYLALSTALTYRPDDYEADLLLAQITAFQGGNNLSDASFVRLSQTYPQVAHRTAVVYHDTLLAMGRWPELAEHSLQMALADRREEAAWVKSMFLALRNGQLTVAFLQRHDADIMRLPPHVQLLLAAEREIESGRPGSGLGLLREHYSGPLNPTYARLHMDMVERLGRADLARVLFGHYAIAFSPTEETCLLYEIERSGGEVAIARTDLSASWRRQLDPAGLNAILTALIRNPDRAAYQQLKERLNQSLMPGLPAGALWVTALVCGAPEDAGEWAAQVQRENGLALPRIRAVNLASIDAADPASPRFLISLLPLTRDQIWALMDQPGAVAKDRVRH
jgi:hypothetical protein